MTTSPFSRFHRSLSPAALGFVLVLAGGFARQTAQAQEGRKRKIPVVDKIAGGTNHQAFSGSVQSLDLEQHVLEVNASEGKTMEIFPIKKGVSISTADGGKFKLKELTPGTNVIVYYDQRGDHRTVKQIVVLAARPDEQKKKAPPPS
jgi:hypothetical protein